MWDSENLHWMKYARFSNFVLRAVWENFKNYTECSMRDYQNLHKCIMRDSQSINWIQYAKFSKWYWMRHVRFSNLILKVLCEFLKIYSECSMWDSQSVY